MRSLSTIHKILICCAGVNIVVAALHMSVVGNTLNGSFDGSIYKTESGSIVSREIWIGCYIHSVVMLANCTWALLSTCARERASSQKSYAVVSWFMNALLGGFFLCTVASLILIVKVMGGNRVEAHRESSEFTWVWNALILLGCFVTGELLARIYLRMGRRGLETAALSDKNV